MAGAVAAFLRPCSTERMDALFGTAQNIKISPFTALEQFGIDLNEVQVWMVKHGVYQLPTQELVDRLGFLLKGFVRPIEICAGHGALGRALGIPRTDSYMQLRPEIQAHYRMLGQPIISPPDDVEKLEAREAVRKYDPDVVIGCFCTQLGTPDVPQSSPYGVDETALLQHPSVRRYIMVGNENTHGQKLILNLPHETWYNGEPWLVSRGMDQSLNRVYMWNQ